MCYVNIWHLSIGKEVCESVLHEGIPVKINITVIVGNSDSNVTLFLKT